jgi:hypothetical protein
MRSGFIMVAVGAMLLVAACSGGAATVPSTAAQTETAAAESSGPTDGGSDADGQPSAEADASVTAPSVAPAGGGGGGGGTAAGVCELVTADELEGIFGEPVKMTLLPGPPDNCIVESEDGDALTAWSLTTAQSSAIYDAFTSDPATIEVAGVGDRAAIVQNTGLLVLKGGSLVVVMISGGADMSEDEGIEASKQIGALAAGRL